MNDKLWEDLYWTSEVTRPDYLAKILNSIIRKENNDSDHFIYDQETARRAIKTEKAKQIYLSQHDQQSLEQFDKLVDKNIQFNIFSSLKKPELDVFGLFSRDSESDTDTQVNKTNYLNREYIISRGGVEKLLRELFNSVHLEDDLIKPRPLDVYLIKIAKINTNTKLFSDTVRVRIRPHVHVLPLRCQPNENGDKLKLSLLQRLERMENILYNLSNHVS